MSAHRLTLTEFLLARIADDEADQRSGIGKRYGSGDQWHRLGCGLNNMNGDPCDCEIPARVLAECEAKRRIVEECAAVTSAADGFSVWRVAAAHAGFTCRLLALAYADHPDYDEEWRL